MDEPVLELMPKKYGGETTVTSLRISKKLLADIDSISARTGRTRNELISICLEFAVEHIEIPDK